MPRKKSRMFSAFVLTCDRLSTWPAASKTTITVIDLWTSMPTYLILLIGRLLAIGNLDFRNLRLLLAGRPFTLRADAILILLANSPNKELMRFIRANLKSLHG